MLPYFYEESKLDITWHISGITSLVVALGIAITQLRFGESVVQIPLVFIHLAGQRCIHNAIKMRQKHVTMERSYLSCLGAPGSTLAWLRINSR